VHALLLDNRDYATGDKGGSATTAEFDDQKRLAAAAYSYARYGLGSSSYPTFEPARHDVTFDLRLLKSNPIHLL
jgi:hypothetical protein